MPAEQKQAPRPDLGAFARRTQLLRRSHEVVAHGPALELGARARSVHDEIVDQPGPRVRASKPRHPAVASIGRGEHVARGQTPHAFCEQQRRRRGLVVADDALKARSKPRTVELVALRGHCVAEQRRRTEHPAPDDDEPLGRCAPSAELQHLAQISRARSGQTPARHAHPRREAVDGAERYVPPFDAALTEEHRRGRRSRRDRAEGGSRPRVEVLVDVALSRDAEPGSAHGADRRRERVDRVGERALLRDERPEQHRGQQQTGGSDAGGDEGAPRAVGTHAVHAEGDSAHNATHLPDSLDS